MEQQIVSKFNKCNLLNTKSNIVTYLFGIILCITASLFIAPKNYSLFHSTMMFTGIIVRFSVLLFALNTYDILKNDFLLVLGIGYGFVGSLDILYTIAYCQAKALGFSHTNLTSQLWASARFLGSVATLIASIILYKDFKKLKINLFFYGYFIVTFFILISIYYLRIFPNVYITNKGFTAFNTYTRNITCFIFLCSMVLFFKARHKSNREMIVFMELSVGLRILSELMFSIFTNPYGIVHITAFVLRALSFYLLYKAVIQIGLKKPYRKLYSDFIETREKLFNENNQKRLLEEAFLKNDECYQLLIEHSHDAIMIYAENRIIFANDTASRLVGFENSNDLIGLAVTNFLHEDEKMNFKNSINKIISEKNISYSYESKILTKEGTSIDIEGRATYIIYGGKTAILDIMRDISSDKQVEILKKDIVENQRILKETLEFNKVLTEHFANISHELRTPLNVILGAVQILPIYTKDVSSANLVKVRNYLKTMKQNCYRLLRLVNNFIDLSRIDSGFFTLNLKNHNIISVIEDITISVAEYVESKGITLIFDTDIEEKFMSFDADKIERIMLNLLSNAIKFTTSGDEINVIISDNGESISISVKDTGPGIPKDKLEIIFERFRQVDKSLSRRSEGSGIGLSLVKALVELHGGEVSVRSSIGVGTEFIIELPVKILEGQAKNIKEIHTKSKIERIDIEFSDIYSLNS